MENMAITEVLGKIYSHQILSDWMEYEGLLYYYYKDKLSFYKELVAMIDTNEFSIEPDCVFFKGSFTKARLNNIVE